MAQQRAALLRLQQQQERAHGAEQEKAHEAQPERAHGGLRQRAAMAVGRRSQSGSQREQGMPNDPASQKQLPRSVKATALASG